MRASFLHGRGIRRFTVAIAFALTAASPCLADDLDSLLGEMDGAYGHYRQAMFYLRTGNPAVAGFDLKQMRAKWSAILENYADDPPPPFAADADFGASLSAVAEAIESGLEQVAAGDAEAGRAVLAPVRATLSDLRRRNRLYLPSDCIDEFSAAADSLWRFRHAPPAFADAEAVNGLRRSAAIVEHQLARCRELAASVYGTGEEFQTLFDGAARSVQSLWPAIDDADEQRIINILREFRSFDQMIYLRYG